MQAFVALTGVLSILAGASLQLPRLSGLLMPSEPDGLLMHLFGAMAMFLGIMLVIASRDLRRRGSIVAWEGVLRLAGFLLMAGYGVWGAGGMTLVASGLFDLVIGVAYLVGLPRHLGTSLGALLFDRVPPVTG